VPHTPEEHQRSRHVKYHQGAFDKRTGCTPVLKNVGRLNE
jgi:hypothetical protein